MNEYPRIVRAYLREGFQMKVVFKDGLAGVVDLRKLVPLKFLNRLQNSGELILPVIDEVAGSSVGRMVKISLLFVLMN